VRDRGDTPAPGSSGGPCRVRFFHSTARGSGPTAARDV